MNENVIEFRNNQGLATKQRLCAPVDEVGKYSVAYKDDEKEYVRYFDKMQDVYTFMARIQTGTRYELLGWKDEE